MRRSAFLALALTLCVTGINTATAVPEVETGAVPQVGRPSELTANTANPANTAHAEQLAPQDVAPDPEDEAKLDPAPDSSPSSILRNSPNLEYERTLRLQHDQLVERYHSNYDEVNRGKQPANKIEPCLINTDLLNGIGNDKSIVFWEGSCQNGLAEGFGRVYVVDSGRKTFELLGNFHADEPQFTTIYYAKNTTVQSQTVFFYGKANRYQSSGITINSNHINNDLIVSLQFVDKVNLITYQKEISKNSKYVLNIEDFGNYVHLIHDLSNTPYSTLTMSYRMRDRSTNDQVGYSFTGLTNGTLQGRYRDEQGTEHSIQVLPEDVLLHINRVNEFVDVNIENCIENVIKAVPVINAYLQVICAPTYQDTVCERMQCKQMCQVGSTITPEDAAVKELLLRLVEHHNRHPLRSYLAQAIQHSAMVAHSQQAAAVRQSQALLAPKPPREQYIAAQPVQVSAPPPPAQPQQVDTSPIPVNDGRPFPNLEPPPPSATSAPSIPTIADASSNGNDSNRGRGSVFAPRQDLRAAVDTARAAPAAGAAPAGPDGVMPSNPAAAGTVGAMGPDAPQTLDDVLLPADADVADIAAARQRLEQQQAAQHTDLDGTYVATERTTLTSEEQRLREDIVNAEINRYVDAQPQPDLTSDEPTPEQAP